MKLWDEMCLWLCLGLYMGLCLAAVLGLGRLVLILVGVL
jgi:hypothetical protein